MIQNGVELRYIPNEYIDDKEFNNGLKKKDLVIWTPYSTKEIVGETGKQKKVFAPKTTRHLIPSRPLHVDIPAHWFKKNTPIEELNKRFSRFLQNKALKRFPPDQTIDCKFYGEELFVFSEKTSF